MPKITVGGGPSNGHEPGYEADRPEPVQPAPEPQPEPEPVPEPEDEAGEPAPDVED